MLRSLIRTSLLFLLVATVWLPAAWAQPPRPVPVPSPQPSPQPSPPAPAADSAPAPTPRPAAFGPWWRDSRLRSEIDLDAATIDQMEQRFLDHRLRLADLSEELERARAAVEFQLHRSEPDTSALRSAEDGLYELRGQIEAARTELLVEIRALLTAEQWSQLSDYQRRRRPPVPEASSIPRSPRPGPRSPVSAPPAPESPQPEIPPRPPAPAAAPSPPSAPLPPAPPALSWWTEPEVRAKLGLDADQLRALEAETQDAAQRLRELQDEVGRQEGKLSRIVDSEQLDRDAARAQVEQVTLARRALLDAGRALERRLLEILTPDQRRLLNQP